VVLIKTPNVLCCTIDQETWGNYQCTSNAARNNIFILRSKINVTANENLLYIISFFDIVKISRWIIHSGTLFIESKRSSKVTSATSSLGLGNAT
jgi:hypothetical protein